MDHPWRCVVWQPEQQQWEPDRGDLGRGYLPEQYEGSRGVRRPPLGGRAPEFRQRAAAQPHRGAARELRAGSDRRGPTRANSAAPTVSPGTNNVAEVLIRRSVVAADAGPDLLVVNTVAGAPGNQVVLIGNDVAQTTTNDPMDLSPLTPNLCQFFTGSESCN